MRGSVDTVFQMQTHSGSFWFLFSFIFRNEKRTTQKKRWDFANGFDGLLVGTVRFIFGAGNLAKRSAAHFHELLFVTDCEAFANGHEVFEVT